MTTAAPPRSWTLPALAHADAQQAGAAAATAKAVADDIARLRARQHARLAATSRAWSGPAATAALDRLVELDGDLGRLGGAAEDLADVLVGYARQLDAAHHRHRWSLGRIAELGAVVVVTGAVVAVTMGTAAPELAAADAALIEGEVAAATEAAEEVAVAARGAGEACRAVASAARAIRGFLPAAKLARVQTVLYTGWDATHQLLAEGQLSPRRLGADVAIGVALPGTLGLLGRAARGVPVLGDALAVREATLPSRALLATGQAASTSAASQYLSTGHVNVEAVAVEGASAGGYRLVTDSVRIAARPWINEISDGIRPPNRAPWRLDPAKAKEVLIHPRYRNFLEVSERNGKVYVTRDLAGHGGTVYKLYERKGRNLVFVADLDGYGERINKHKSPGSEILPLSQFRKRS